MFNSIFGHARSQTAVAIAVEEDVLETPMTARGRLSFPNGLSYCGHIVQVVPHNQRLIVDSISFLGVSNGGQGFLKVWTTFAGQVRTYVVPAMRTNPVSAPDTVSGTASLDLIADPGTAVLAAYYRGGNVNKAGITAIAVSLAGRYTEL